MYSIHSSDSPCQAREALTAEQVYLRALVSYTAIGRFRVNNSDSDSVYTAPSSPTRNADASSPPPTFLAMNAEDRLESLERGQSEQRDATQTLQDTLNAILHRLGNIDFQCFDHTPHPDVPSDVPAPVTCAVSPTPTPRNRLKPGVPSDFDGNRLKGRAFLNSCLLYMSLCSAEFTDDQAKIHWVLSYMKLGHAATFADRTLRYEARTNTSRYQHWHAFRVAFIEAFCPENEATVALMHLESEVYFQGKRSVDTYTDEFEDLIDLSGYTDALAIVIKFHRGLDPAIQDKIAESGADRPKDDHLSGWYAAARRFDLNRLANEAFHSSTPKRSAPATRNVFIRTPTPTPLPPPAPVSRANPSPLPPGIPMDIDAQRSGQAPAICYCCGKAGHLK
jgi:hypothetical protein